MKTPIYALPRKKKPFPARQIYARGGEAEISVERAFMQIFLGRLFLGRLGVAQGKNQRLRRKKIGAEAMVLNTRLSSNNEGCGCK